MGFTGFPPAAFHFFDGLAADNTRAFWQAHRAEYQRDVRGPMDDLLAELADFGPFHVFRPNRDVRFSKDKTPYKEHLGAYGESEAGAGFYVQVSANGLITGAGYYQMAADQLERFRHAVDAPATGAEVAALCAGLARRSYEIGAISELKTAPRGYPRDHPRIHLLRRKGLVATRSWPVAGWMSTKSALRKVRDAWAGTAELNAWLDAHVGPSTMAPDDDELARFGPF